MDQKVFPSCDDTDDVCEFHWSVDYMWTMVYVNQTKLYGEPIVFRDGQFYRRNILVSGEEKTDCGNYEKMTEKEMSETPMSDGKYALIYAINSEYPGPNIIVHEGQTVVVHVRNNLINEGVTIHWHGLRQRGTPYMDGVSMVTQCPINPDETFTYRFKADIPGTYWYHSHHGVTRSDGLYGAIIVLPRKKRTDIEEVEEELIMFVQDRYHRHSSIMTTLQEKMLMMYYKDSFDQEVCEFTHTGVKGAAVNIQALNSLVINGKGYLLNSTTDEKTIPVPLENFHVKSNVFYKFRITNSAMLNPFRVSIDNHQLTVIAVDGNDIQPMTVESVIVHNGERFDVMIHTNEETKKYWIRAEILAIKESDLVTLRTPESAYAILAYEGAMEKEPVSERDICREEKPCLVLNCHYGQGSPDAVGLYQECLDVADMKSTGDSIHMYPLPMPNDGDEIKEIFLNFHFVGNTYVILVYRLGSTNTPTNSTNIRCTAIHSAAVNGKKFLKPEFPFLMRPHDIWMLSNVCDSCTQCICHHIVKVKKGQIVQIILNNHDKMAHPIHLHGYTFHVLKVAYPSYEPGNGTVSKINPDILYSADFSSQQWRDSSWHDDSVPGLNLFDPPLKDTITIPKQGYVVIRFRADNPGFWFMHCHLEVHTQLGMGLVLQVGEPEDLPPVPIGFPLCGLINDEASDRQPPKTSGYLMWGYFILVFVLLVIAVSLIAYIRHLRCVIQTLDISMMPPISQRADNDNNRERDSLIRQHRKDTYYSLST